jgi:hypothetical protein
LEKVRQGTFRRLRKRLKEGDVQGVIAELRRLPVPPAEQSLVEREIQYLYKHTAHMNYKYLREASLPMGSGAIESAIRRVINLRLKGNGTLWLKGNAEAMLVLRATALSDRWDEVLDHARASMATNRRIDWRWSPHRMPRTSKPQVTSQTRKLQRVAPQSLIPLRA